MATVEIGTLPSRIDLTVLAGNPMTLTVPVLDGAGSAVAAASLSSARAHVRPRTDSDQILHVFSTDNDPADAEITGTTAASVVLTATSEVTSLWQVTWTGVAPQTVVWWDLEVTDTDDIPHQITIPGTITLIHQVTR
jgi:hypothetical protein